MAWLRDRADTIQEGIGVRRFVIGSIVLLVLGVYEWLSIKLAERGMTALTGIPTWAIGVTVGLALLFWWMLEYAVRLRGSLSPKLRVEFRPDSGGIIQTPIKQTKRTIDRNTNNVTEETTEYQAVYVRGLVTATADKAVSDCMAYLTGVRKKDPNTGQYAATQYLDDLQLPWSHIGREAITIPKGIRRYFDIVNVHEPTMRLDPSGPWPLTLRKLFDEHTSYQLDLLVSGDGISQKMTMELTWAGDLKTVAGLQVVGS